MQFLIIIVGLLFAYPASNMSDGKSEEVVLTKLKEHVYQHTTYMDAGKFGRVSCNGMIVFDKNEAIIFDTPAYDSTSAKLISWVQDSLKCKVIAVIPTHFHEDCLGGLNEFHRQGIPSYASAKTIESAKAKHFPVPQKSFNENLNLKVGNRKVVIEFDGEGHTRDNVIGYFPSEKVMFGGCLIKEIDATKGNLADANVNAWSATVAKIKQKYPDTEVVIPGHGKIGDTALLDYTIKLFKVQ